MAQPGGYQYPTYVNPNIPFNKSGAPPLVNGQPVVTLGAQNGIPSPQFHTAGTPSSQSSKDPSREASRDPSPTHNLHNQYRPQLQRPPMPPINGQQMTNPSPVPPPTRPPPMNYQQNPYNQSDENSRMAHVPSQNYKPTENINKTAELFPWSQSEFTTSTPTLTPSQINPSTGPPQIFPSEQKQVLQQPTVSSPNFSQTRNDNATATTMIPRSEPQGLNHLPTSNVQIANTGSSNTQNVFPLRTQPMQPMQNAPQTQNLVQQTQQQPNLMTPQVPPFVNHANTPGFGTNSPLLPPPPPPTVQNQNTQQQQQQQNLLTNQRRYPATNPYGAPPPNTAMSPIASNQGVIGQQQKYSQPPGPPPLTGQPPNMPPMPGPQSQNPYNVRPQYPGQMSNVPLDNMQNRYPPAYGTDPMNELNNQMAGMKVTQAGFNKLWGMESVDLLQCRNVLPPEKVEPPKIHLHQEFLDSVNCSPDIFRCTLTKIPESNSLLQKSRLPLGVLIHPFKDLNHLPVIQCSTIVRCRACRTYINPFVYFADSKRWKCNLCFRINELPDEFQFDPVTKSYGDPSRRPEVKTSTIEFIAPSEYMLRPPQPAVYLFILDVSRLAVDSGYLAIVCNTISDELSRLPGDGRTQVGFLAVDSAIHFFCIPDNVSQPHEMIMLDVDDVFLPCPDNLIVNLKEREELVRDLLAQLPTKFQGTHDTSSALGAGLQAAYKLMSPTGGRITVFQTCLPNLGPGALTAREDPSTRASKDVPHLNPATDFYKRLALDCSGQQIAVDLFLLNSQYSDLATLSGMCKFSGGCIHHMPLFRADKPQCAEPLERMLRRYLTRKIGFEAVLRIRCTRGLSIHTFHGNFFVRSTDLLSLPNVNPDAGFGMQIAIEESLSDVQSVCFQAALLYTSSKGERRIRVHTLCLPVTANLSDVLHSADQQCITGLVCKMAVDRSLQSSLSDARDALINVVIDVLSSYKLSQSIGTGGLSAPGNLKLLPLYVIALLKCIAFRSGLNTRLDDRVFAMCQLKTLPLYQLMQYVYPDLYPVHALDDRHSKDLDGKICPQPPRLHLSAEKLDSRGAFLMDAADKIYIYVGKNVHPNFCSNVLGVSAFSSIPEEMYDLPELDTVESERLRNFVFSLQDEKPYYAAVQIIRDDSHFRTLFTERLIEDRLESALSYYEFLQHLKTQVK